MRSFKDLAIWKRSFELVDKVYDQSNLLPKDEKFGLASQIKRSAVSIPSNIAEGCSRKTNKEVARYLEIAIGSAFELETQILIAEKRKMLDKANTAPILDELRQIQKMIYAFREKLSK